MDESSSENFEKRQRMLLEVLEETEKECLPLIRKFTFFKSKSKANTNLCPDGGSPKSTVDMKSFRNQESIFKETDMLATKPFRNAEGIFKVPNAMPGNLKRKYTTPDYKLHPHKWTKYSLDVPADDLSDAANAKAAFDFLSELHARRDDSQQEEMDVDEDKPVFRKPTRTQKVQKAEFRDSKLVMPEYVVGQKIERVKVPKILDSNLCQRVKLNHLEDDES